jgi:hypothetical protein
MVPIIKIHFQRMGVLSGLEFCISIPPSAETSGSELSALRADYVSGPYRHFSDNMLLDN